MLASGALICPKCQTVFAGEEQFCPRDGVPLKAANSVDPAPADPLLGSVLGGRYRLLAQLGQGGMGTVYRALHLLMDKPVAVKVLRRDLAAAGEAVARFRREARSASRLDHDHCIRVTDFGQSEDGLLYLVMELLDGESLGQVVRRGPLPSARVASIGMAVAEALAHAHELGIIHRDLKPDNIFLARRPRGRELVKVLDFGLAKLVSDAALGPSITRDGTVFGTPEYMAPEQAEGDTLDGRTDLYALGCVLYEMLTGDVPFTAPGFVALLTKQVSDIPEPPRARRPDLDIPEGLAQIVLRCLQKKPDERYATATELAEALAPFAARDSSGMMLLHAAAPTTTTPSGPVTPLPPTVPHPTTEQRRPRSWLLPAVLAVLAVTAGGALVLRARHTETTDEASSLNEALRLLSAGQYDDAELRLRTLHKQHDTVAVEEALSALAEHRGNRLAALAYLHRATRLRPDDASARLKLGQLLLRLAQPEQACLVLQQVTRLGRSPANDPELRAALTAARCSGQF